MPQTPMVLLPRVWEAHSNLTWSEGPLHSLTSRADGVAGNTVTWVDEGF